MYRVNTTALHKDAHHLSVLFSFQTQPSQALESILEDQ